MGKWIGIDAEAPGSLPPERTPVLICGLNGVVQHVAYQLVFDHNGAYWEDMLGYGDDIDLFDSSQPVTHWMQLPSPPYSPTHNGGENDG